MKSVSFFSGFRELKKNLTAEEKSKLHLLYRSNQILFSSEARTIAYLLPACIPMAEFVLITAVYSLIRFDNARSPFLSLVLLSVCCMSFIVLKSSLQYPFRVTECSREYSKLGFNYNRKASKLDKLYFECCSPFSWKIGNTFTVSQDTIPRIINDIIVSNVINLLIAY